MIETIKEQLHHFYFSVIKTEGKNLEQLKFMCEFHITLFFFAIAVFLTLFFQKMWWFWWGLTLPVISYSGARIWNIYGYVMARLKNKDSKKDYIS